MENLFLSRIISYLLTLLTVCGAWDTTRTRITKGHPINDMEAMTILSEKIVKPEDHGHIFDSALHPDPWCRMLAE